jgi:hypothetical protein
MSTATGIGTRQGGAFSTYLGSLRETHLDEKTEHTDRDAIKNLLKTLAPTGLTIVPEPRKVAGKGAPDFKVRQNGQIVGYLEAKPIGTDLAVTLKSDQIKRYKSLSSNLLLTNYLDWVWVRGDHVQDDKLCAIDDLRSSRTHLDAVQAERVGALVRGFLSVPPQRIGRAFDLAEALARRSSLLRDFLGDELARQQRDDKGERLYGLFQAFKHQVSEAISPSEFADAFAQTLSYGLFLSKLNANGYSLNLTNAKQYIPKSFRLIQELVSFLAELEAASYGDVKWIIDEILSITNGMDVAAVKNDLSFKNRTKTIVTVRTVDEEEWRLFSRDPFIYFYEDFLSKYDPKLRKSRGVYYTPPPVVKFIVKSVDDILKKAFSLEEGLADYKRVTILEFACGTGTFIVEAVERILDQVGQAKTEAIIKEHILQNIFAFEYLIAPYTIAHLKLSQYFEDRQIKIPDGKQLNILLTNTLEPLEPQRNFLLPALSEETRKALEVKRGPSS